MPTDAMAGAWSSLRSVEITGCCSMCMPSPLQHGELELLDALHKWYGGEDACGDEL